MDECWVCDGALYGLDILLVDWIIYRDYRMSIFKRETEIYRCHLARFLKSNIGFIMDIPKTDFLELRLNNDACTLPCGLLRI